MTSADRPPAVRRWIRRPLLWGIAAMLLAACLFFVDVRTARAQDRTFDDGYRVTGRVASGWDGEAHLDLTYRHPSTGRTIHTSTHLRNPQALRPRNGLVDLEVSRSDPKIVIVVGNRFPATANVPNYLPLLALPFVLWLARRLTVSRNARLVNADSTTYVMNASASPPTWWAVRWRLHLFPLDAASPARPVCTVPLVEQPAFSDTVAVEVKGSPHPYSRVVARVRETGVVLWPSGRALRSSGRHSETGMRVRRHPKTTRAVFVAGALLCVVGFVGTSIGTSAYDVLERDREVTAIVTRTGERSGNRFAVDVTYVWNGESLRGSIDAGEQLRKEDKLTIRIDPESPRRVWSTTDPTPPGTSDGGLAGFAVLGGLALLITGGFLRRRR